MQKIDELKTQPIIGEYYLVPCIIKEKIVETYNNINADWEIVDGELFKPIVFTEHVKQLYIYPIINHLHNDRKTGQDYYHYHIDYRFIKTINKRSLFAKQITPNHIFTSNPRYNLIGDNLEYKIEYHPLRCLTLHNKGIAGAVKIEKLKHKCIYKGKCPHRGYSLLQEVPKRESYETIENGIKHIKYGNVITCPLHGLKFNNETKQLIK